MLPYEAALWRAVLWKQKKKFLNQFSFNYSEFNIIQKKLFMKQKELGQDLVEISSQVSTEKSLS